MTSETDCVFHRDFGRFYPRIAYAQKSHLYDTEGKRYLDASSGAVAANLGHGVTAIIDAMTAQASQVAFAHTLRFETDVLHEASARIAQLTPEALTRVFFASGGSEANESAIKLARQHFVDRGRSSKSVVIGRRRSYHGNTLGALSAGGDTPRREGFEPIMLDFPHVSEIEFTDEPDSSTAADTAVDELDTLIRRIGAHTVAAFICEPIVGGQQGGVVPPKDYLRRVQHLCQKHDVLLIVDEVMTGFGRTGEHFAVDHFGVTPDILTFGKGVTGGYAPLSGMAVHDRLIASLNSHGNGVFRHGFTYSGHPVSVAAANAALKYYVDHDVLDNVRVQSKYLYDKLTRLQEQFRCMRNLRGKGLLLGFDLVGMDGQRISAEAFNVRAMSNGAVFYAGSKGGNLPDHLLVAPPLTIDRTDADELIDVLHQTLSEYCAPDDLS